MKSRSAKWLLYSAGSIPSKRRAAALWKDHEAVAHDENAHGALTDDSVVAALAFFPGGEGLLQRRLLHGHGIQLGTDLRAIPGQGTEDARLGAQNLWVHRAGEVVDATEVVAVCHIQLGLKIGADKDDGRRRIQGAGAQRATSKPDMSGRQTSRMTESNNSQARRASASSPEAASASPNPAAAGFGSGGADWFGGHRRAVFVIARLRPPCPARPR